MYDPILAPDHTCCNESKTIKKTITMTNLFLVLLSFLAHDVYKKIFFVYEYEAYKSDTGIHIFMPNLSWVILAFSHDVTSP